MVRHPRDSEAVSELQEVGIPAHEHDQRKTTHPQMVPAPPTGRGVQRRHQECKEVFHAWYPIPQSM
jgi:hypothetical protein